MNIAQGFAALLLVAALGACSPASTAGSDEKSLRAEAARDVRPSEEKLAPVYDAQGNELDPELADAVREKMEEEKALDSGQEDASAPSDSGAAVADDET